MTARDLSEIDDGCDLSPGSEGWRDVAACSSRPAEWWFPGPGAAGVHAVGLAREVCSTCPVQDACLAYALAGKVRDGVWGGLAEKERRVLLRAQRGNNVAAAGCSGCAGVVHRLHGWAGRVAA